MGMFDTVVCRHPLPHHQDAEFQTKDLAAIALGEHFLSGLLDEYEITADGRLCRHVHEREWTADPEAFLGGYMRSVRDWWEDVPDAHGDVVIYTTDEIPGEQHGRWVAFRVRFTNGRIEEVHEVQTREEYATRPVGSTALLADVAGEQEAPDADDRPEVRALLGRLLEEAWTLGTLLRECSGHWGSRIPSTASTTRAAKSARSRDRPVESWRPSRA